MSDDNPYSPPASSITREILPVASEASIRKGYWFVFPVDNAIIRACGSGISAIERIYVDEQIVSERRNFRNSSEHAFSANGQDYAITFTVVSLLKGQLACALLKNGSVIKVLKARYVSGLTFSGLRIIPGLVVGLAAGLIASHFELPLWMLLVPGCLMLFLFRKPVKKGAFVVEDVTPAP